MPIEEDNYIIFNHVNKIYSDNEFKTIALSDISFNIKKGDIVVFYGNSGAGKTTALNLLGGLDKATSGSIIVDNVDLSKISLDKMTLYRRYDVGFVFQFYSLVQNLSVLDNVKLGTEIGNNCLNPKEILNKVGLKDYLKKLPCQLSGGQMQRVAVARAIAKKPKILLCDEPTGALDKISGIEVLKLIQDVSKENNITTIIVTHNDNICNIANKIIEFDSGKIKNIIINEKPCNVEDIEW